MVNVHDFSCGDLKLHWDWRPFALWSKVTNVVQVTCSCNCSAHVTSPQPHLWPNHFLCLGKDFHLFKFFLQHSKIVALVQSEFEFKRECKDQDSQVHRIFHLVFSSPKFPKHLFYLILNRNGTVLFMGIFLCIQSCPDQFWVIKHASRDIKI